MHCDFSNEIQHIKSLEVLKKLDGYYKTEQKKGVMVYTTIVIDVMQGEEREKFLDRINRMNRIFFIYPLIL